MMSFGSRIKQLRDARGMSQTDLARILNVTPKAVSKWEAGKMEPRPPMVTRIAQALGVGRDELINGAPAKSADAGRPTATPVPAAVEVQIEQAISRAMAKVLERMAKAVLAG